MFVLNLSQKMKEIYKLKPSENIPSNSKKTFPLWNWYVKPEIINRKKYVLFLEREYYLSVWVEGATSKNISELFRNQLEIVLEITGIPLSEIENLKIQDFHMIHRDTKFINQLIFKLPNHLIFKPSISSSFYSLPFSML